MNTIKIFATKLMRDKVGALMNKTMPETLQLNESSDYLFATNLRIALIPFRLVTVLSDDTINMVEANIPCIIDEQENETRYSPLYRELKYEMVEKTLILRAEINLHEVRLRHPKNDGYVLLNDNKNAYSMFFLDENGEYSWRGIKSIAMQQYTLYGNDTFTLCWDNLPLIRVFRRP